MSGSAFVDGAVVRSVHRVTTALRTGSDAAIDQPSEQRACRLPGKRQDSEVDLGCCLERRLSESFVARLEPIGIRALPNAARQDQFRVIDLLQPSL